MISFGKIIFYNLRIFCSSRVWWVGIEPQNFARQKGKQKSQGRATSRNRSQPLTPGGREKVTQINVCIANKQMHDNHKDRLSLPKRKVIKMLKGQTKHIDKEQGKTKHEV